MCASISSSSPPPPPPPFSFLQPTPRRDDYYDDQIEVSIAKGKTEEEEERLHLKFEGWSRYVRTYVRILVRSKPKSCRRPSFVASLELDFSSSYKCAAHVRTSMEYSELLNWYTRYDMHILRNWWHDHYGFMFQFVFFVASSLFMAGIQNEGKLFFLGSKLTTSLRWSRRRVSHAINHTQMKKGIQLIFLLLCMPMLIPHSPLRCQPARQSVSQSARRALVFYVRSSMTSLVLNLLSYDIFITFFISSFLLAYFDQSSLQQGRFRLRSM